MRLSKRRFERLIWDVRQEALQQGRCEALDHVCNDLGQQKAQCRDVSFTYNTLLQAQAQAEGRRLLVYFCDEMSAQDAIDFRTRFIQAGWMGLEKFPTFDRDAMLTLIEPGKINHEIFEHAMLLALEKDQREVVLKEFGTVKEATLEYQRQKDNGTPKQLLRHPCFQTIFSFFDNLLNPVNQNQEATEEIVNSKEDNLIFNTEVSTTNNYSLGGHYV
jgi:hypothetical protein